MRKSILQESLLLIGCVIAVIAIVLPRGVFGLDMEDEGWVLTAYQQIFTHPQSVSYNFLYYNGVLVGGVWNLLLGQYGLIAFRVLGTVVEILKVLLVYFILRPYCNKYAAVLGCITYETIFITTLTTHNQLSSFLGLLAIFFIVKSLEKQQWQYMLAGGTVVGINVFTRIPNLASCALILVLIIFWIETHNNKTTLQLLAAAIGGFFIGCLLEVLLMFCLGHLQIFIENIACGFSASNDADSTHNLSSMGHSYFLQLRTIYYQIAFVAVIGFTFSYIKRKVQPQNRNLYLALLILLSFITLFMAYHQHRSIVGNRLYAIQTLICLFIILYAPSKLKYVATLAILFYYILPLGSDWGYNSGITYQAMCLSLPLIVSYLLTEFMNKTLQQHIFMLPISIFALVMVGYSMYVGGKESVKSYKILLSNTQQYSVNSPLATTILTTDIYQRNLNPLLDELSHYVKPNDVLLCYQSPAMVHYLTQTQPYLENAWPWTYTNEAMRKHFQKAQEQSDIFPVIVREKGWVLDIFNTQQYPDWDNSEAEENRFHKNKKIQLIQDFIRDNDYCVVWDNGVFQILIRNE